MIEDVNMTARGFALGASMLLLLILVSGKVRFDIKVAVAGLLLGSSAYLLNSSPLIERSMAVQPWVDLVSLLTPFWTWIFARRLFESEPPARWAWVYIAIYVGSWFLSNFVPSTGLTGFYIIHVTSLALIADLARVALRGRDDDLIEKRRMIRLWLPLLVGAQAGGILLIELYIGSGRVDPLVQLVNAVLILALTLFAGLVLLETDRQLLVESVRAQPMRGEEGPILSPSEKVLKGKLEQAMADGYYRTPGLGITGLAEHLETPEHRLRALVNQRLGYRNFSAFLNRHRIAEAREALADPAKVDLPVLTIAMDLGYNSLPTFNRAFRAETGTNPTDFRRTAIGQN
ncbi:AraC family transcriptional regulator [Qipengyuania sphaerica]|uniref:AraC family transcriptional regulator n=1 Tax=Qipengyuania sphaerica TaxID=2867243 RepID=UPI001C8812CA|nr:helix-turn-helix domain-containing protein [Qipengyuania sphaerica]MBX7540947.1 helix-turn-helix domain-containing protein [Qipengyuania sphaerica]